MLLPLKEKSCFQICTYILIFSNILLKATCTYMNRNVFMCYTAPCVDCMSKTMFCTWHEKMCDQLMCSRLKYWATTNIGDRRVFLDISSLQFSVLLNVVATAPKHTQTVCCTTFNQSSAAFCPFFFNGFNALFLFLLSSISFSLL